MRSTAFGKQRNPATATSFGKASLSVVVVSSGPAMVAERAAQVLCSAQVDFTAQLIVVSQDHNPAVAALVERTGAEFVAAPPGSTRAEMCDLGMNRAHGTIVAVRDDVAVGDARWLNAYQAILPPREVPAPVEAVVMDTQVAGRVALADRSFAAIDSQARADTIEMAEAV